MRNLNIKKQIANFLMVVTFMTGTAIFTLANPNGLTETNLFESATSSTTNLPGNVFTVGGNQVQWHTVYLYEGTCIGINLHGSGYK